MSEEIKKLQEELQKLETRNEEVKDKVEKNNEILQSLGNMKITKSDLFNESRIEDYKKLLKQKDEILVQQNLLITETERALKGEMTNDEELQAEIKDLSQKTKENEGNIEALLNEIETVEEHISSIAADLPDNDLEEKEKILDEIIQKKEVEIYLIQKLGNLHVLNDVYKEGKVNKLMMQILKNESNKTEQENEAAEILKRMSLAKQSPKRNENFKTGRKVTPFFWTAAATGALTGALIGKTHKN